MSHTEFNRDLHIHGLTTPLLRPQPNGHYTHTRSTTWRHILYEAHKHMGHIKRERARYTLSIRHNDTKTLWLHCSIRNSFYIKKTFSVLPFFLRPQNAPSNVLPLASHTQHAMPKWRNFVILCSRTGGRHTKHFNYNIKNDFKSCNFILFRVILSSMLAQSSAVASTRATIYDLKELFGMAAEEFFAHFNTCRSSSSSFPIC